MEYKTRAYPEFSACGLNCGLCPRYHTVGTSRCPGCAGEGFTNVHPSCGILSCCQRKGVEHCGLCGEYPCKKYDGADLSDSFITHKNQLVDIDKVKKIGMEAYETELNEKTTILRELIKNYDDGRRKNFYCIAVNLLDLQDVNAVMAQIADENESEAILKAKAATAVGLFEEMAESRSVLLKLRKKRENKKMPIDFKKEHKDLYQPKSTPSIIDVPGMVFICIDGKGDPNLSEEYSAALEALYGLSYAIKMSKMGGNQPEGYFDYVVPPLEGFWSVDDGDFIGGGAAITDKSKFRWTSLIRQPDFVTEDVFKTTKTAISKKKPNLDTSKARLVSITEGLCVQVMHIGSYDDEPATIAAIDRYAIENGYEIDINDTRRHHEIYLSDPRKVAPEKLKTVIRHPIRKA